ncbi:MAG TPA: MFS transporter [Candidatus Bacteroides merdigallinarum]|uniref:MFS transporter n=1 Tax=Candidatus Bacteroides merdigallinarum TaxID=2838473 RepID=A0A9D2J2K8_9BACE|nr:MFS transporter [Candidatus Bacteroides merdigallinarum]
MATLKEKVGYGFGDMSSSMFWKIFSYYLPFFYSNIFGLTLADAGLLMLITRIWDAVSDPMMGVIADRTKTRWGRYRPYLLWIAAPFAIAGILLFTTPEWSYTGKLIWAYATYILMMTVYTGINVPYGAMLGVMTDDSNTKTVFSSYRMFFAYGGSFIALGAWEPLCNMFKSMGYGQADSWQYSMIIIASICFCGFLLCFSMTREHVQNVSGESLGKDVKSLLTNSPWWILNGIALLSNFFNTVRGATAAYYFKDCVSTDAFLDFGVFNIVLYAGLFLMIGEVCNMLGVALAVPFSTRLGKKTTYYLSLVGLVLFSVLFFFVPDTVTGWWLMMLFQVLISICTGIISPLIWSMYADVADYAEHKDGTASTGLIFSSGSMAQKFGGAFAGWAVMALLAAFGYNTAENAVQTPEALNGLKYLMSFIPAGIALLSILVIFIYPLNYSRMQKITTDLKERRKETH